ncbi:GntR family transcriptional regulator [Rhodococcus opacus]|uniref:GntR family transcriptional regulator n=1 Tax=Rhodococcus opacus TaxID=37919 RepID=UPI000AE342C0|nr:GntR family transcriptional regulator [Rhodococcus opacus]
MAEPVVGGADEGAATSPLVQQLVETIQERISRGTYGFGTWIRQEPLAQELGVSRMPIREALAQLQALGVVEIVPNRGARPKLPSMRELLEVFEVRAVLEGHAAHEAARQITYVQLRELFDAVESFRGVVEQALAGEVDPEELRASWVHANNAFHDTVLAACGNDQLRATVASLHHRIPRNLTWTALDADPRLLDENAAAHAAIAEAIDRRDGNLARDLTIEHSRRARELIIKRSHQSFAP